LYPRGRSKDLLANLLLGDLAGLIEQILFADIENKAGKKFGFDEPLAAGDTSGELPSRILFKSRDMICDSCF
jgi:hypothetical protein